jgi:hypothetical protein
LAAGDQQFFLGQDVNLSVVVRGPRQRALSGHWRQLTRGKIARRVPGRPVLMDTVCPAGPGDGACLRVDLEVALA